MTKKDVMDQQHMTSWGLSWEIDADGDVCLHTVHADKIYLSEDDICEMKSVMADFYYATPTT